MNCINHLLFHLWPWSSEKLLKISHKCLPYLISNLYPPIICIHNSANSIPLVLVRCLCVEKCCVSIPCHQLIIPTILWRHMSSSMPNHLLSSTFVAWIASISIVLHFMASSIWSFFVSQQLAFPRSVVKSTLKRKAQSPWGFFPLKWSSLSKAHFKHAFLSFFIKRKAHFFELFVYFFKKSPDLILSH